MSLSIHTYILLDFFSESKLFPPIESFMIGQVILHSEEVTPTVSQSTPQGLGIKKTLNYLFYGGGEGGGVTKNFIFCFNHFFENYYLLWYENYIESKKIYLVILSQHKIVLLFKKQNLNKIIEIGKMILIKLLRFLKS